MVKNPAPFPRTLSFKGVYALSCVPWSKDLYTGLVLAHFGRQFWMTSLGQDGASMSNPWGRCKMQNISFCGVHLHLCWCPYFETLLCWSFHVVLVLRFYVQMCVGHPNFRRTNLCWTPNFDVHICVGRPFLTYKFVLDSQFIRTHLRWSPYVDVQICVGPPILTYKFVFAH